MTRGERTTIKRLRRRRRHFQQFLHFMRQHGIAARNPQQAANYEAAITEVSVEIRQLTQAAKAADKICEGIGVKR